MGLGEFQPINPLGMHAHRPERKGTRQLVAFYNVENLFDTEDNPVRDDDDFLPQGRYRWTAAKYAQKLDQLSKVIMAIDHNPMGPDMLGLVEVENRKVVEDLIETYPVSKRNYRIIHEESTDNRGIDVAFVYDPDSFEYEAHWLHRISFPEEPNLRSRDILAVKGRIAGHAIFVFINHWPSRREGKENTAHRRDAAAYELRKAIEEIYEEDADPNILIMGDFNDDPRDKSLRYTLGAELSLSEVGDQELFNPMHVHHDEDRRGTTWREGEWNLFDQFLLSDDLLTGRKGLKYVPRSAGIFRPNWLQVGFGRGKHAPRRSIFRGRFESDGYSDHFPIFLSLDAAE